MPTPASPDTTNSAAMLAAGTSTIPKSCGRTPRSAGLPSFRPRRAGANWSGRTAIQTSRTITNPPWNHSSTVLVNQIKNEHA